MGLTQYFTGIIYNPKEYDFSKSQKAFFEVAALATKLKKPEYAYFLDDSTLNALMAKNCKWNTAIFYSPKVHKKLPDYYYPYHGKIHRISNLKHIKKIWPELFSKKKLQEK
jgi:FMN phosphatase YigB (HAD superfamily)